MQSCHQILTSHLLKPALSNQHYHPEPNFCIRRRSASGRGEIILFLHDADQPLVTLRAYSARVISSARIYFVDLNL